MYLSALAATISLLALVVTITDYVFGGCGDDIIFDYSGNNFINAGWGNDTVAVGDGNSVIAGDCGSDTFVMTNRLAICVPDQPLSSNDIEVKAEILDFNICHDKLVFDVGLDTNDDGIRDTFLDSADDLILPYNDFGWAVFSSDEFNVEVTLKGIDAGYMNYIEHYNINIFDFALHSNTKTYTLIHKTEGDVLVSLSYLIKSKLSYSNGAGSPEPIRATTGSPSLKSITVVGCSPR